MEQERETPVERAERQTKEVMSILALYTALASALMVICLIILFVMGYEPGKAKAEPETVLLGFPHIEECHVEIPKSVEQEMRDMGIGEWPEACRRALRYPL